MVLKFKMLPTQWVFICSIFLTLNRQCKWATLRVRLNYATTHRHPPPPTTSQNISTTTHHHPPSPSTSQNISTTHHHPPPAKIYLLTCPTTHWQPKCIHHHQQQSKIYPSKKSFYKENIKIFYSKLNDEKQNKNDD